MLNDVEEKEILQMKITQDEWANTRKYVRLSTGIKMAYVELGDPNGEVLILQHGMTDNSRSWSLAVSYFTKAGYHIYLPDLRGMGKTDEADGYYTTVTYATDLKAFFDAMGIEKATLIGHSLGSFTVQTFCLMFPERCNRIVLVSSIPVRGLQNKTLAGAYAAYIAPLGEDDHPSDDFMDKWYATDPKEEEVESEFDTFLAYMKQEAQCLSKKSWTNIFLGLMISTLEDIYPMLDRNLSVLVLHGDEDTMTPGTYQEELCNLFHVDENSYINYEKIGHNIPFEIPHRCADDILTWLQTGRVAQ